MIVTKEFIDIGNLGLDSGEVLKDATLAYETLGKLDPKKDNAILIFHALSGDSHVAGKYKEDDRKSGWWDDYVGPKKTIDTDRYFVICFNVIGGCMGSTGPNHIDPSTKELYGISFPFITIDDMVRAQKKAIDILGIKKLFAVVGGSMGGMQALSFVKLYPNSSRLVIPIASAARQSAQNIGFHEIGRQAIISDHEWNDGKSIPKTGLSLARMIGHITYMSEKSLMKKFGRKLQGKDSLGFTLNKEFQIESYLHYQGKAFVDRFDANSYLYITRAIDYFDIDLDRAFLKTDSRFLVLSFTSDWLYTSDDSKEIVNALQRNMVDVTYFDIDFDYGHDSFLLDNKVQKNVMKSFLDGAYNEIR